MSSEFVYLPAPKTITDYKGKKYMIERVISTSNDGCKVIVELYDGQIKDIYLCNPEGNKNHIDMLHM